MIRNLKNTLILIHCQSNSTGKYIVLVLFVFLFLSCRTNQELKFQLPNGDQVKHTTIRELEKEENVHYVQYLGFVLEYKDSLFPEAILMLEDNNNIVGTDVLNEEKINQLKSRTVESIKLIYIVPAGLAKRDFEFEGIIKKMYKDFDQELKLNEGFELRKKGKQYVIVTFHAFANPNYSIIIYPNYN